jgi:uncharacterized OB-fold protein
VTSRPEPPTTEGTDAFWDASRQRRFLVQWCTACDAAIFYPREACPTCLSADSLTWKESSGQGAVYAVSVQHRPAHPTLADRVPYAVALVEIDAGDGTHTVRVLSNVVNCDPLSVGVGDPVTLTWEALSDGRNLPLFEPVAGTGSRPHGRDAGARRSEEPADA